MNNLPKACPKTMSTTTQLQRPRRPLFMQSLSVDKADIRKENGSPRRGKPLLTKSYSSPSTLNTVHEKRHFNKTSPVQLPKELNKKPVTKGERTVHNLYKSAEHGMDSCTKLQNVNSGVSCIVSQNKLPLSKPLSSRVLERREKKAPVTASIHPVCYKRVAFSSGNKDEEKHVEVDAELYRESTPRPSSSCRRHPVFHIRHGSNTPRELLKPIPEKPPDDHLTKLTGMSDVLTSPWRYHSNGTHCHETEESIFLFKRGEIGGLDPVKRAMINNWIVDVNVQTGRK